jgi:hypothetical protein
MENDFLAYILYTVVIVLCVLPFALDYRSRKKNENHLYKSLVEFAVNHSCMIHKYEVCRNFIIGIDDDNNSIFFFKKLEFDSSYRYIQLATIAQCQTIKKMASYVEKERLQNAIEKVELSFKPKDKSKNEILIELFDQKTNIQLSGELEFAEKWVQLINGRL